MNDGSDPVTARPTRAMLVRRAILWGPCCVRRAGGSGDLHLGYANGQLPEHDPRACANCHIMQDYTRGRNRATTTLRRVWTATCRMICGKICFQGGQRFFHSVAFTLDNFHEPIRSSHATGGHADNC